MSETIRVTIQQTRIDVVLGRTQVTFSAVRAALAAASATVSFNSKRIVDLADPTSDQDAATKAYVDAEVASVVSGGSRTSLTTDTTLTLGSGGDEFNNTGATGEVIATLPTAASIGSTKWSVEFFTTAAQYLQIKAQGSNVIRAQSFTTAAGGFLRTNERGAYIKISYQGGGEFAVAGTPLGNWSDA